MTDSISYSQFRKDQRVSWVIRLSRNLQFQLFKFGLWLGDRLTLSQLQKIGRGIGKLAYWLLSKERAIARAQLERVFPEVSEFTRSQWVHECFRHFGMLLMEFFALNHLMKNHQEHVIVEGYPLVEQALGKGKGVIFVGLHMGNWEMLLPFAAEKGHYAALVTTNVPDDRLNELIRQHRQRGNLELIPRGDPQTLRKILHCFKRNGILFLAIDQDTNVPSIWVPFFGMLAKTPASVARIAMKTGAPVLGFTTLRQPDGSFEVKIYDWGSFHSESKVLEEDLYRITRWLNQRIEELIRIDPPQWAWFHRRWRHQASTEDEAFSKKMEQKLGGGSN